jgi:branched-chain amino acid transport system permease protein
MFEAFLQQIVNGLMMGSIYLLVALGMMLIYGVMEVLNFAHGVLFMLGAYLCHFFFTRLFGSYVAALIGAMLVLGLVGYGLERFIFRRLRDSLRNQVIASLGLVLVIQNLVIALWGPQALMLRLDYAGILVPLGPLRFSLQQVLIVAVTFLVVVALHFFLARSKLGTAIRATSQNREAARIVGIDVERIYWLSFALATALAALGGGLLGPLFLVSPTMGDLPLLKGLAAIVLGGMGSVWGAVIGALLIGISEAVSTLVIPTDYRDAIPFAAIVLILLFWPQGLFGRPLRGEA